MASKLDKSKFGLSLSSTLLRFNLLYWVSNTTKIVTFTIDAIMLTFSQFYAAKVIKFNFLLSLVRRDRQTLTLSKRRTNWNVSPNPIVKQEKAREGEASTTTAAVANKFHIHYNIIEIVAVKFSRNKFITKKLKNKIRFFTWLSF